MTTFTGKVERIWLHMLDRTQHRLSFKKMCLLFFFLYAGLVMIAIVIIQQSKPDQHLIYTDNSGYYFDTRLYENIKSDNSTKDSQAQNVVEEKKCFHSGKIKVSSETYENRVLGKITISSWYKYNHVRKLRRKIERS